MAVTEAVDLSVMLTNVDAAATDGVDTEWRSTDTELLKVNKQGPLEATVTAHRSGSADIVITMTRGGETSEEFNVDFNVASLSVDEASAVLPWPNSLTTTQVKTVAIDVTNAPSDGAVSIDVEWQTTNPTVLVVVALDSMTAEVRAVSRGFAELVAVVQPEGFERVELRKRIAVLQGWSAVTAGGSTCGITTDNVAYCWGDNFNGQVGDGSRSDRPAPQRVASGDLGGRLHVIVPSQGYDKTFANKLEREDFLDLLKLADVVETLDHQGPSSEEAFLDAGRRVVDLSERLIAVWDGKRARGKGGTADIVSYARERGTEVIVIWPAGVVR